MKIQDEKSNYDASTREKLICIGYYSEWTTLLLGMNKKYEGFIRRLAEVNFYNDSEKRTPVSQVAKDLGFKAADITKWISDIYDDLNNLNDTNPGLFRTAGIRHDLAFRHINYTANFTIWLPQTPREYEAFEFYFIKAKVGAGSFWVKDIRHVFENGEYAVWLSLDSEMPNRYRELLVDKGLFHGVVHFMDFFNKSEDEIDLKLRKWYKNL